MPCLNVLVQHLWSHACSVLSRFSCSLWKCSCSLHVVNKLLLIHQPSSQTRPWVWFEIIKLKYFYIHYIYRTWSHIWPFLVVPMYTRKKSIIRWVFKTLSLFHIFNIYTEMVKQDAKSRLYVQIIISEIHMLQPQSQTKL